MKDFDLVLIPPISFIRNQKCYKHQANIDIYLKSINGENQPLVTTEPVEFEILRVEVQDFKQSPIILEDSMNIPQISKQKPRITTCNLLDFEHWDFD